MSEFTVFTEGDANDLSTWSNVPYLFTRELVEKGHKINLVNVEPNYFINEIFNRVILPIINKSLGYSTTYRFRRTGLFRLGVSRKMKKSLIEYSNTDYFVSFSFSYHPKKITDKKCIMFCDWTYEYYIRKMLKREPYKIEMAEIINQNEMLMTCDTVVSLFPDIAEYIIKNNGIDNMNYFGNVINSLTSPSPDTINYKLNSKNVLFIGSKKYLAGLEYLVNTVNTIMLGDGENIEINVIGVLETDYISNEDLSAIHFHGYLNKTVPEQCSLYYKLIEDSHVIINPSNDWGGFSSLIEAMYHFTPVITTRFSSFVSTFGNEIDFGYYIDETYSLSKRISDIFNLQETEYIEMCEAANNVVRMFTWSEYMDSFLSNI